MGPEIACELMGHVITQCEIKCGKEMLSAKSQLKKTNPCARHVNKITCEKELIVDCDYSREVCATFL